MARTFPKPPETEIAAPVVAWLRDLDWEVYQEVQLPGGRRADIVGVRGPLVWVVEVKASVSLQLLEQAIEWLRFAHYVSIAAPPGKWQVNRFISTVTRDYGIGAFLAHARIAGYQEPYAAEHWRPELHRRADVSRLRSVLCDEQKSTLAAGSKSGGYWTPFRSTCDALRRFLEDHPGATLKKAIDGIAHHYATPASARGSLRQWILAGKVPMVSLVDGKLVLDPKAKDAA